MRAKLVLYLGVMLAFVYVSVIACFFLLTPDQKIEILSLGSWNTTQIKDWSQIIGTIIGVVVGVSGLVLGYYYFHGSRQYQDVTSQNTRVRFMIEQLISVIDQIHEDACEVLFEKSIGEDDLRTLQRKIVLKGCIITSLLECNRIKETVGSRGSSTICELHSSISNYVSNALTSLEPNQFLESDPKYLDGFLATYNEARIHLVSLLT